jgi:hypothetical protein
MPLLPPGNLCIHRFARTFDGVAEGSDALRYKCRTRATERMTTSITFRITATMDCDDVGTLVPVTGLRAKGRRFGAPTASRISRAARRSSTRLRTRMWCSSRGRWI